MTLVELDREGGLTMEEAIHEHARIVGRYIYEGGARGMAAELFFFSAHGKVTKACAHYA